jgi:hypothetical protein
MKRFFTIAAAALLTTTFAASAFAGWGPNGQYGNAVPGSQPVGQSSRPSNHPASAPINTPFDPNANHGHVPGSFQDKVAKGQIGNGPSSKMGYNPNKPIFTPGNGGVFVPQSPRPSRERPFPTSQVNNYPQQHQQYPQNYPTNTNNGYGNGSSWGGYGNNSYPKQTYPQTGSYGNNGGGFFGNDVLNRPTNYPQPHYPQKPAPSRPSHYPPAQPQHQYPVGGYGNVGQQMPSTGGYGGGSSWGGYGGSSASQYGMFAR